MPRKPGSLPVQARPGQAYTPGPRLYGLLRPLPSWHRHRRGSRYPLRGKDPRVPGRETPSLSHFSEVKLNEATLTTRTVFAPTPRTNIFCRGARTHTFAR